jgi:hypothetical protein
MVIGASLLIESRLSSEPPAWASRASSGRSGYFAAPRPTAAPQRPITIPYVDALSRNRIV